MFKIKKGGITYNELHMCPTNGLNERIYALKEDLLQINFEHKNIIIDIGWYPEFDPKGSFVIKVVKDFNWEQPLCEQRTKCIKEVYEVLEKQIAKIDI